MGSYILNEGDGTNITATNLIGLKGIEGRKNGNDATAYFMKDAHGNVISLFGPNGTALANYEYDIWGNQMQEDASTFDNPFRYCSEFLDEESGLIYLRARYYNPNTGRFTQEDTARDGLNWYIYAGNNPVIFVDPTGKEKEGDVEKYGLNSLKYRLLVALGNAWRNGPEENRGRIEAVADKLRDFDDNSFTRALLINDQDGASFKDDGTLAPGHNAVLLVNSKGESLLFSYYPIDQTVPAVFSEHAELRIGVLDNAQTSDFLYGNGWTPRLIATDGDIEYEQYERFAEFSITNGQGYNMYAAAVKIAEDASTYMLVGHQCDNVAQGILEAGGVNYTVRFSPNLSYEDV